eukprot:15462128-Alexandrium_andersonii.AAC.1
MASRQGFAGLLRSKSQGLRGLRIGADCGLKFVISRPWSPPITHFVSRLGTCARTHPSGASGANVEAFPGPSQFQ